MTGKALITGASGFLGRHLIEALRRSGATTFALTRSLSGLSRADRQIAVSKETDPAALIPIVEEVSPDWIFHLAGRSIASSMEDLYSANVLYGAALLIASRTASSRPTVVLAGSAAEYGPEAAALDTVSEDVPCRPTSSYGISKFAQTLHALAEQDRVVVARLFNVVGPFMPQHLALGSFAARISQMTGDERSISTGSLSVVRDFVMVEHVADALVALAGSPPPSPTVINICTGQGTSLRTLVESLVAASGKDVSIEESKAIGSPTSKGISRFVGDPTRLNAWGISLPLPDPDRLARSLIKASHLP
ncbi:NAD-dependent epimerase/dehydratase family protein [Pelagibacterium montanilacus]|uniref:NAD-dependent epimerase/dehydratase family protein n=1 Tax=Pelagibacterium montanilacus TaxID=2185280 RepID=UPI0013DF19C0|nr:NAD-dependent epimerase/dehydratase family protein [Pelagibacterium montanilacus]